MPAYPKDFFDQNRNKTEEDPGLCFVLMPFGKKFDPVWKIIHETAEGEEFNLTCIRADHISKPGNIMEDVLEYIVSAGTVIADLTDRNPNVFYELGIAHAIKPSSAVYLLSQSMDFIPFDLRHLRCLVYKPDLSDLGKKLADAFSQGGLRQYRITLREGERLKIPARLKGKDRCLYELECEARYLGDNGIKFILRATRFVARRNPEEFYNDGHFLGEGDNELDLPWLDWKLRYGGGDRTKATILLQRGKK